MLALNQFRRKGKGRGLAGALPTGEDVWRAVRRETPPSSLCYFARMPGLDAPHPMSLPSYAVQARFPETADAAPETRGIVSVIVPIYNEAAHVEELLGSIEASPVAKEIVIVDDGSTDGTREKLLAWPRSGGVTVIFHERNCGKGAAIRTALRYARGEYVLIQDSDLEYDPQDYPALLRPLEEGEANVVYGVRPDRPERGLRFFLGAKLLTILANLFYGAGIHDEATCYKVFRRSLLSRISLECRRFEFCPEVTAKVCRLGEKISEVPVRYMPRNRDQGKKLRPSDGWLAIWTLIRFRLVSRRAFTSQPEAPNPPFPVAFSRLPLR
jgi:dolichol-phosphate mannosyltransferase